MDEQVLQYAWQTLRFPTQGLQSVQGMQLEIVKQGQLNANQGPDFLQAEVRIAGVSWHGAVELHTSTDQWYLHGHHKDPFYNQTVLHVVGHSTGRAVQRADGTYIQELDLGPLLTPALLDRYRQLMQQQAFIPCAGLVAQVPALVRSSWLDTVGWQRLQQRAEALQPLLDEAAGDWETLLWRLLCRAMGAPHNQQPMESLASFLPVSVVKRYHTQPEQLEALLFGAAGMLDEPMDDYTTALRAEWQYLQHKHRLGSPAPMQWLMHRMRPVSFPTVRLAQLAALLTRLPNLFLLVEKPELLRPDITPSFYWTTHYRLGQAATPRPKRLGTTICAGIQLNALIPFSVLYFKHTGRTEAIAALQSRMEILSAEDNRITRGMKEIGFSNTQAFESQALIHLYKNYCSFKKCTKCGIGHALLRSC